MFVHSEKIELMKVREIVRVLGIPQCTCSFLQSIEVAIEHIKEQSAKKGDGYRLIIVDGQLLCDYNKDIS
jgi:hypothetical protein